MFLRFAHRNLILVVCLALICAVTVALSSRSGIARISRVKAANILLPPAGTTITVNSTGDVTNSSDGLCTLHEAITAANTNTASGLAAGECAAGGNSDSDTITFSIPGTITLTTELPAIASDLVIHGPGANALTVRRSTADGTPRFRIFTVDSATTVQINNITISQGHTADGGGSIFSRGDSGGGIFNNGTLMLDGVTISGNQTGTGREAAGDGGGIANFGTLTITRSTISGNKTGFGGSGGFGGGIDNRGTLTIINSTISDNQTGNAGRFGVGGYGGGIFNTTQMVLSLVNVTISGNRTGACCTGNASYAAPGGGVYNGGECSLKNTIVANNHAGLVGGEHPDLKGTFNSQDYNLIGNVSGATIGGATSHNITGIDPKLGALSFNGGSTQTLSPLLGSPVIDAGDDCVTSNSCVPPVASAITDQRGDGFNRSADGNGDGIDTADIGAFEVQSRLVTNTNDSGVGSLRQAITDANVDSGTDALNFQAGLNGTITLLTSLPDLATSMALNGPGASQMTVKRSTADGTPRFRIFTVNAATNVEIRKITISQGYTADGTGRHSSGGFGGGIFNEGTLVLEGVTISGNQTGTGEGTGGPGGGIANYDTLTITRSTISGNITGIGFRIGGSGGGIANFGNLEIINSTVSGNQTGGGTFGGGSGGGINNATSLVLVNVTISGNRTGVSSDPSSGSGGGVRNDGACSLQNTIVANNFVGLFGGVSPDLDGTFDSHGYNLIGTTAGAIFTGTTTHDITNVNARLGPLANNGGATMTQAPSTGSPAIDAGSNALARDQNSITLSTDQRGVGFERISNATVDIGAFEVQTGPPMILFGQSTHTVNESSALATITVNRLGDTSAPATVKYATSDATGVNFVCNPHTAGQLTGGASRKCDYHIAAGRLRFAAGETSKTIVFSIVNDVYVEGAETLTISLSNPTGGALGSPNVATVTITDNDPPGQENPINGTAFYVRMLYVDLLSREPEPAGLAAWIHRIDFCGQSGEPPPPCDRVTVGGDGFLRSAEFFDREFFVTRLYRTALGRIPRYDDVGDLAFVSGFLTDANLELNKQDLVTEIMSRPEFGNIYNGLNNSLYVDRLIQTAAVTIPSVDRNYWADALNGLIKTRAQVFRELSDRSEVSEKYLHEAQVVSCYYGFFTRNPDDAYLTYLDRLDRGEINLGDLANAFINAAEYRQRFGP